MIALYLLGILIAWMFQEALGVAGADHTAAARLAPEALDRLRPLRSRTSSSPGACARCAARSIPARRLSAI